MPDQNPDMSQYLGVFLDEAAEHLDLLQQNTLRLEDDGGSDSPEILSEMFRSAHTLKGSSRAMGFAEFANLTHRMEDVLDKLRKDELEISTPLIDTIFRCLDTLNAIKADIASGGDGCEDASGVVERLGSFLSQEQAGSRSREADSDTARSITYGSTLTELERALIEQGARDGREFWLLRITVAHDCAMKSVRVMMVQWALKEIADIIRPFPCEAEIEDDDSETEFAILLSTNEAKAALEDAACGVSEITRATARPWEDAADERILTRQTAGGKTLAGSSAEPSLRADPPPADTKSRSPRSKMGHTIRVDVSVLDNLLDLVGELVTDKTIAAQLASSFAARHPHHELAGQLEETASHLGRISADLHNEVMKARMLPIANVFNRFPRMVRDLAHTADKRIDLRIEGEETELDRSVIEIIGDPLSHLLRNSVDHGIEPPGEREAAGKPPTGTITIAAHHEDNHMVIVVADDGKGIDLAKVKEQAVARNMITAQDAERMSHHAALSLVFRPGLTTADEVTDVSGRGVGMDVVKSSLQQIGAQLGIESRPGKGTRVTIRLPLSLAIIGVLLVEAGPGTYAIPLGSVCEAIHVAPEQIRRTNGRDAVAHRGSALPLLVLEESLFGQERSAGHRGPVKHHPVIVVSVENQRIGFVVDRLVGEQEIVIKPLGEFLGHIRGLSGATLLTDGSIALIIDVPNLVTEAVESVHQQAAQGA